MRAVLALKCKKRIKISFWCGMMVRPVYAHIPTGMEIRGQTIKFANSPPCACRGSTGQKL